MTTGRGNFEGGLTRNARNRCGHGCSSEGRNWRRFRHGLLGDGERIRPLLIGEVPRPKAASARVDLSARLGHVGAPPLPPHASAAHRTQSRPSGSGNASPWHRATMLTFFSSRSADNRSTGAGWLPMNRVQSSQQSIAVAGHIDTSNHNPGRLGDQLTSEINGQVTAARCCRLSQLFGSLTKWNELGVDARPG